MGKHCIQIPSCSHVGFTAFEAGGAHDMVAYTFYAGNSVVTSPLRQLDSLLGDTGLPWRGGDRGLFFKSRSF